MLPEQHVWIFALDASSAPGADFSTREAAESWIAARRLALRLGLVIGRARDRGDAPNCVATFSCASQEHVHFVDGVSAEAG